MNGRILIVDDDENVLAVLNEVFTYEGFDALTVPQTDDLFELVRAYEPALVLLDFSLGGKNGGVWCEQLKGDAEFAKLPVIIYTAYSNKGIKKGSYGCDDFIAKPFDLEDLVGRIKFLVKQGSNIYEEKNINTALNENN